jgi:hypothetical protein
LIVIVPVVTLFAGLLSFGSAAVTVTVVGPPAVVGVPVIGQVIVAPTANAAGAGGLHGPCVRPAGSPVATHVVDVVAVGPLFVQLMLPLYGEPTLPVASVTGFACTSGLIPSLVVQPVLQLGCALLVIVFTIAVVPAVTGVVTVTVNVLLVLLFGSTTCSVVHDVPATAPLAHDQPSPVPVYVVDTGTVSPIVVLPLVPPVFVVVIV